VQENYCAFITWTTLSSFQTTQSDTVMHSVMHYTRLGLTFSAQIGYIKPWKHYNKLHVTISARSGHNRINLTMGRLLITTWYLLLLQQWWWVWAIIKYWCNSELTQCKQVLAAGNFCKFHQNSKITNVFKVLMQVFHFAVHISKFAYHTTDKQENYYVDA